MQQRTALSKKDWEQLTTKCRLFLINNFHKFKTDRKIDVALDICKKAMPLTVNSNNSGEVIHRHVVEPFDIDSRVETLMQGRMSCLGKN